MDTKKTTEMSFREAWFQLLNGKKIKRPSWSGYWAWEKGTIMMHCHDGQVIDREALKPEALEVYGGWQAPLYGYTEDSVKNAPAVIEAEGTEE